MHHSRFQALFQGRRFATSHISPLCSVLTLRLSQQQLRLRARAGGQPMRGCCAPQLRNRGGPLGPRGRPGRSPRPRYPKTRGSRDGSGGETPLLSPRRFHIRNYAYARAREPSRADSSPPPGMVGWGTHAPPRPPAATLVSRLPPESFIPVRARRRARRSRQRRGPRAWGPGERARCVFHSSSSDACVCALLVGVASS